MIIHPPLGITSRLCAGCRVGGVDISIEYAGESSDGRQVYRYYLDGQGIEIEADDLRSGRGGGSLQEGLEGLFAFLGAAAEAEQYHTRYPDSEPENLDMFPDAVNKWAARNADELGSLSCELEAQKLIEE